MENNNLPEENLAKRPEDIAPEAAPAPEAQPVEPAQPAEEPRHGIDAQRYAAPEIEDDDPDDAPTEWVPSRFEKRIHAIPEKQWNLYQTLAGLAIGVLTVIALFFGGEGLNPLFLVALVLALFAPNMLEDRGRRKLVRLRMVMVITIAAGLVFMVVYLGTTKGWHFFTKKEEAESALRAIRARLA